MITKINKSIISITIKILFIFLISLIIAIFTFLIWAKRGISIDEIEIFDHKFSKVYIKWNKKLHINIDRMKKLPSEASDFSLPPLYLTLKIVDNTIDKIDIQHYETPTDDISVKYHDKRLEIQSELVSFSASVQFLKSHIFIPDLKLSSKAQKLTMKGEVRIHQKHNHVELLASAKLDDNQKADIFLEIKKDTIYITANSNSIKDLRFLNRFIAISDSVKPWIFDKLQASTYQLNNLSSHFPLSHPSKFLDNLQALATVKNASYQFDPKLSPIVSPSAAISYRNNKLMIKPQDATYDTYPISHTKVMLNDLQNKPQLELYFHTKELVNPSFLGIIKHYLQKVPLKQFSGTNAIDFRLFYDLHSSKTDIQADISVKDSHMSINNHPVNIYDANVHLDNNELTIDYAKFKSFKALKTSFSGTLNLKTLLGNIKIYISHFYTPAIKLLNDVTVRLKFKKDGIHINTSNSHWQMFKHLQFLAGKHSMFLDKNKTLHVNKIHLYKPGAFNAKIEGSLSLNNSQSNNTLSLDFKELNALFDRNTTLRLEYPFSIKVDRKNANHFQASRSIQFSQSDKPISLEKFSFDTGNHLGLYIKDFRFKDSFQSDFNFIFHKDKKLGSIDISNINAHIAFTKPELFIIKNKNLHFDINTTKKVIIHESDYNISYQHDGKIHQFTMHDLSKLYPLSPLFQKFGIKKGRLNLISRDLENYNLFTTLNYFPIPGYINTDKNDTIFIAATYGKDGFKTIINDAITLKVGDELSLDIENTNLDLQPFLKQKPSKSDDKMMPIEIQAKDGFLQLSENEKILYSKLHARIENKTVKASLFHKEGQALLSLQNSNIELYGEKFSDAFIRNLINFQGLDGGKYNFFIKGNSEKMLGGIELNQATFKGFALYNNILSFLNTIPALVTFKNPGFNADGFKVKTGEIRFEQLKDMVNIKSIKLKGDASNILGSGHVDLEKNEIDLSLRIFLFKEMGSILSSVPIAGYLLLGEDGSLTTTISIKGNLEKPDISIDLGSDILMAPINIIKRTLMAPVRFFDWITGSDEKETKPKF